MLNDGICHNPSNRIDEWFCECKSGFTGIFCEVNINECVSRPCTWPGTLSCNDLDGSYQCICNEGFEGDFCENNVNECESDPCENDAICHDKMGYYLCQCNPGWTGENCETDIDFCDERINRDCKNGAKCIDSVLNFSCECLAGWTGSQCDVDINECDSIPCSGNGICSNGFDEYVGLEGEFEFEIVNLTIYFQNC